LLEVQPKDDGNLVLKTRNTIEIEGETRPALIADTLSLLVVNAAAYEGPGSKHELSI
jgi:hypothetical protein